MRLITVSILYFCLVMLYQTQRHPVPDEICSPSFCPSYVNECVNILKGFTLSVCLGAGGMGMMMMMQMYFTNSSKVTLWLQQWHTSNSGWYASLQPSL